jgi:hypothetical protein
MGTHGVETPELDKQLEIIRSGKAEVVQQFIDWLLDDQPYVLASWGRDTEGFDKSDLSPDHLYPQYPMRLELMADFFGIDLVKIEQERRALLEAIREES